MTAAGCGDATLPVALVCLVVPTAGAVAGLTARLAPADRDTSAMDIVQVLPLVAWAAGGFAVQTTTALYSVTGRIPVLYAGGVDAVAGPEVGIELVSYVREMAAIEIFQAARSAGLMAAGWWLLRQFYADEDGGEH